MVGWVYVVTNKALPGLVKVGYTTRSDVNKRLREFDQAGLPYPYEKAYALWIVEPRKLEQRVHQSLTIWRENKEWFRCPIEKAKETIEQLAQDHVALLDKEKNTPVAVQEEAWSGYSKEPSRQSDSPPALTILFIGLPILLCILLALFIGLLEAFFQFLTSPFGGGLLAIFLLFLVMLFCAVIPSVYWPRLKNFSEDREKLEANGRKDRGSP